MQADGRGRCPRPKGFCAESGNSTLGFFPPIPPPAANACRWAAKSKCKIVFDSQGFVSGLNSEKAGQFFSGGTFPSHGLSLVSASKVSRSRFLAQLAFVSSARFRVGFVQSPKFASRFFGQVLVSVGFERSCQFFQQKLLLALQSLKIGVSFACKVSGKLSS